MISQVILNGLVTGLTLALPAIALTLTYSILKFPNFAIGAMLTLGAYYAFALNTLLELPLLVAAIFAAILLSVTLIATDRIVFSKLRDRTSITLLVASIGVSFVLENIARLIFGNTARSFDVAVTGGYELWTLRVNAEEAYTAVTAFSAMIAIYILLSHTALGRSMRAVADNPTLASVRGVDRESVVRKTWAVSGLLIGGASVLAGLDRAIDPLIGWNYLISVFAGAILGGLGSPVGAVLGAIIIGLVEELSTLVISPNYREATGFLAIALILLLRPQGLLGSVRLAR
jgi:branched-subunit amino acid ABC-type transport system permease component